MESTIKLALAWLLTYAMHSTALLLLAFALSRWSRLSTHTLDFIWKVALVGGLFTSAAQIAFNVHPSGSFALQVGPQVSANGPPSIDPATSPINVADDKTGTPTTLPNAATEHEIVAPGTAAPANPATSGTSFAPSRTTIEIALVVVWALVALLLALTYVARRLMLVGRLANRQHITDGALPAMLDALCRAVGHQSHVSLTSVNTISSPVALGLREICVPEAVLTELSTDEQRGLLAHELAHLARRDPMWLDFASLMERVFFFQPLNRLARREIQRNAEFLCDDWAAERTGTGLPLAHCLARVAEWIEASPLGVPVAGMAEQRSLLVTRIARLIEGKRASSPMSRALAVGAATVMLAGVVAAAPGVSHSGLTLVPESTAAKVVGETPSDSVVSHADSDATSQSELAGRDAQAVRDAVAAQNDAIQRAVRSASMGRDAQAKSETPTVEDPAVIAALIERLKDSDATVRRAAANSLGNLRSRTAVPALIAAITDRNKDVRHAVCEALGNIRDARAVDALSRALKDEHPDVRHAALDALGEFTESEEITAQQIAPSAQDARAETRAKAAEMLGEIGDRSALPILQRLLRDASADVRRQAVEALGKMQDAGSSTQLMPLIRDSDADVRREALNALCELKVVIPASDLNALLTDTDADVRRTAIEYLKEQPALANVAVIQRMMFEDGDEGVREEAVDLLADLRSPEARAALRAALTSTDAAVRRRAAEALGRNRQ